MLRRMLSRKWLVATILVIAAMAVLIRLGIWQLDRLQARRAFNARVTAQISQPLLELTSNSLNSDLSQMEYRSVSVSGVYDFSGEIALRNQYFDDQWGVHLITPLKISGSDRSVLVDRGWIPGDAYQTGNWSQFAEPGNVTLQGVIRLPQSKAELGSRTDPTPVPGTGPLKTWNFVNIARLGEQISEPLLPIYIQQAPDPAWTGLPKRTQPELDLSEGPHLSYAIQWFMFAAILGIGYPFFIRRRDKEGSENLANPPKNKANNRTKEDRSKVSI
jgi:surfeit locus 1 family protein